MAAPPSSEGETQHQRLLWFVRTFEINRSKRAKALHSAHALLMEVDLRIAFVSGAWISSIILACVAIEADLRQIEKLNYQAKAVELFGKDKDLHWLRELRNEILHAREPGTKSAIWQVEGHDIASTHEALEQSARRAIEIMFFRIYNKSET